MNGFQVSDKLVHVGTVFKTCSFNIISYYNFFNPLSKIEGGGKGRERERTREKEHNKLLLYLLPPRIEPAS